jgi:hypothetical protein
MLKTKRLPVSKEPQKLAGIIPPRYDQNIPNACLNQYLDRVIDHWFVIDGQKVFVGDTR